MGFTVITNLAKIDDSMSPQQKINLEVSNNSVVTMAESLRNSPMLKLDPKDGRHITITMSVDQETGEISTKRDFKFSDRK
ncbi:hypothetical protein [Paenimyroides aestuarii]|uniref:Uncharacterized protein n=1 Tax=Paenimyroides aestuarii TaxID=2968490 RepID=A0ABY5NS11_9FLAO|nr:hypothetical protein [Paenimyroides aestuarii]UUV21238.1 hypothetical protein NPX36_13055 [Paenimyroides aestuarii]